MTDILTRFRIAFDSLGFRVVSALVDGWWGVRPVVLLVPSMLLAVQS